MKNHPPLSTDNVTKLEDLQTIRLDAPVGADKVFDSDRPADDFKFNNEVAKVFDDMVNRSVPFYGEMQRMTAELARDFVQDHTNVYDIGCSTGTTIELLDRAIEPKKVNLIGIDNSQEMLDKAAQKLKASKLTHPYTLSLGDAHKGFPIHNASLVTMILTLQFIRPLHRERLVKDICNGMVDNGALIIFEKVTSRDSMFNRLFIDHYYDYKRRNGYSEMEISQKREALENVLIPYRMEENFDLLKASGFKYMEVFFRWYNFCGIVAVK
ncbi:MAG TPA: carboxy-S-adenosyl-L-methionine synthase CmoA [Alphaproteobacteria bacterium]|nr:carboxy-S-adenosyl-L-methionine synthase CmoA [Micavibrio sp.]MBK9562258.1 carboxy-S-adenosyl-L-methionine synthase CmoA [Micavibrio sp.]HQX28078.1 carboxy-S-adenosyl-L-methionine synthase CmoA [Alphaproteobacteria bacterium]